VALDRQECCVSVAQCVHMDAGWISVKVKVSRIHNNQEKINIK